MEQPQIDVNDLIRAMREQLADANQTIALASARGYAFLRKVEELEGKLASLQEPQQSA